jgi:hypothetical protein
MEEVKDEPEMTPEQYEKWFDDEVSKIEKSELIQLATLKKYLNDPAAAERFLDAAAAGETTIPRTPNYKGIKKIDPREFSTNGYEFFAAHHADWAADFEGRLKSVMDDSKVDKFLDSVRGLWVDGYTKRQHDPFFVALKASIREHDRAFFRHRTVFVEERAPADAAPFFTPDEMHVVFETATRMTDTLLEDYLESRSDAPENALSDLFVHRGIFPTQPIRDRVWVEKNYLTSYSMSVSVAEVFAQTWQSGNQPAQGTPTVVSTEYSTLSGRVIAFAPLIPGMTLGQLELLVAPPIEAFALKAIDSVPGAAIPIRELEFGTMPALIGSLPIPDRVLKPY